MKQKKKIISTLVATLLIGVNAICIESLANGNDVSSTETEANITYVDEGLSYATDEGAFDIVNNPNNEMQYLRYIDYATGKDKYVCNKSNCTHDNEECQAFIGDGNIDERDTSVFEYEGKLYFTVIEGESDLLKDDSMSLYQQD